MKYHRRIKQIGYSYTRGIGVILMWLALLMLPAACTLAADTARPVTNEQIENAARAYFVRTAGIPDYEVTVERVENNWARVRLAPVGVDTVDGAPIMYLQKQTPEGNLAPTATIGAAQPGFAPAVDAGADWVVIAGPNTDFTSTELNAAGVPAFIRAP